MAPARLMKIKTIPMIEAAPQSIFASVPVPVLTLMPTAIPMIPRMRQANARPFPTLINICLVLSIIPTDRSRHSAEIADVIHAKVTKARAAKIFEQEPVVSLPLCGHFILEQSFESPLELHVCHKPVVVSPPFPSILLLEIELVIYNENDYR